MSLYVESGYVESGYIEGDIPPIIVRKSDLHFIINSTLNGLYEIGLFFDKQKSDGVLKDGVYIVYGNDGIYSYEVSNGEYVGKRMTDSSSIDEAQIRSIIDDELIKKVDLVADALKNSVEFKQSIASSLVLKIVLQNGDEIPASFVYDEQNNKYVLNYDTSALDGTDYQIVLEVN